MKQVFKHIKAKIFLRGSALALIICAGTMVGCSDFLIRDVPNQTTDLEWWQSKGQLEKALKIIYQPMPVGCINYDAHDVKGSQASGYSNNRVEMEGLTDNGVGSANYISYDNFTSGVTPTNERTAVDIWSMKWMNIRRATRFMENYKKAMIAPDAQPWEGIQTVDRYAAEAKALRAFYHMELFMFFGRIPIVDHSTTPEEQFLVRRPESEVVEWIAREFNEAANNLPTIPQTKSERWRWTKGACYAWCSYLHLYVGDWANAKTMAQKVIELGIYDLYRSNTDLADSYRLQFIHEAFDNNTKEPIITTSGGLRQVQRRLAPPDGGNGQTGISPTASLIDEYEIKEGGLTLAELDPQTRHEYELNPQPAKRDPRMTATIIFPTETFLGYTAQPWNPTHKDAIGKAGSTKTGYWLKKYANPTDRTNYNGTNDGKLDFQIMRYAVVLLNYVEAVIELNEIGDPLIYTYLNDIRNRAGMPDVDQTKYASQPSLRELVRRERRVELAFEGHRLFDIRRWGLAETVMNGEVYGAKPPTESERVLVQKRIFNPARDYLWPIPQTETSTNTSPGMDQNPNY